MTRKTETVICPECGHQACGKTSYFDNLYFDMPCDECDVSNSIEAWRAGPKRDEVVSLAAEKEGAPLEPITPGVFLFKEFMIPMSLTAIELAENTDEHPLYVTEVCNGKAAITEEFAVKLDEYFYKSVGFWKNVKLNYANSLSKYIENRAAWDRSEKEGAPPERIEAMRADFKQALKSDSEPPLGKTLLGKTIKGMMDRSEADQINPDHYKQYPIEVIEIIRRVLTEEQFTGYCVGNEIKYRLRAGFNNPDKIEEDINKALWYGSARREQS